MCTQHGPLLSNLTALKLPWLLPSVLGQAIRSLLPAVRLASQTDLFRARLTLRGFRPHLGAHKPTSWPRFLFSIFLQLLWGKTPLASKVFVCAQQMAKLYLFDSGLFTIQAFT